MATENKSGFACNKCGASLLGDEPLDGYCLVCLLGTALDQEEGPADATGLFDHYRLATHPDGTPVELGRGAMGITYRALEINLRCPVTLKSSARNIWATNRCGFVFCAKRGLRPSCGIPMSLHYCTLE
jgi:hypothetical protein